LRQEADYLAETFADRRRVISTVPAHHIYGFLFTVLLPQQRSLSVRPMHWSRLGELRHVLEKRDLLVSHPELWRYLSRSIAGWPADVLGTSSTAPLRADIHRALLAGGLATLMEVYGSTETGGVGLRSQPEVPFELFPYLSRGESPALCRVLPSGDTVRVELRDRIEWHDERHFVPQGRLDRVVQVGGENVSLQRVEDVLSEVPGIAGATVHAVEVDGILRLEARLRRAPDEAGVLPSRQAVMEVARRKLRPTERPVAVTFSEA
jgi:4-coumarate--CoA ligase (photoactive yellow protein activation family)